MTTKERVQLTNRRHSLLTLCISCQISVDASDAEESKEELSTTAAEETESEASSGFEVELDPAARLLDQEVRSGRLPRNHLFYRLVLNSLKFATQIGDPTDQFQHDPLVRSFCETIKRSGHSRTFNLLTGKRMLKRGRGSAHDLISLGGLQYTIATAV